MSQDLTAPSVNDSYAAQWFLGFPFRNIPPVTLNTYSRY